MPDRECRKLGAVFPERARLDGADHDELGVACARGVGDAYERGVGTEVHDAPPPGAQRETEDDQAEVVLLARGAREHDPRPEPATPPAGEAEEAPAEDARGEVLLRHRDLAPLPAVAELVAVSYTHLTLPTSDPV